MSGSWLPREFPNLKESDFEITSEAVDSYNCIAWAAVDNTKRWDPDDMGQYYWPEGVPREVEIKAFKAVFQTLGFKECVSSAFEDDVEKIVIYATSDNKPTHVARQLPNGKWTSKLGYYEDIEHETLECLGGETVDFLGKINCYGEPAVYMERRRD